jgi:hypothetical protein
MKLNNLLFAVILTFTFGLFSQENASPNEIVIGTFIGKTIPLRDVPVNSITNTKPNELKIIANNLRANEKLNPDGYPQDGKDPLRQPENGSITSYALEENFDGISGAEGGGFTPPGPTGAVGQITMSMLLMLQ